MTRRDLIKTFGLVPMMAGGATVAPHAMQQLHAYDVAETMRRSSALRFKVDGEETMIALDFATGDHFTVRLDRPRTRLAPPLNARVLQSGYVAIVQDATGGRDLIMSAGWRLNPASISALPRDFYKPNRATMLAYVVKTDFVRYSFLIPGGSETGFG